MTAPELFIVAEKLEDMKLKVAVAEADIARAQQGQNATFTVDAWANRSFQAGGEEGWEFGSTVVTGQCGDFVPLSWRFRTTTSACVPA